MEISELTLKLIFLLIPGAIASIVFEKLTENKKWNSFQFVSNSILFGTISYLVAQTITSVCGSKLYDGFWQQLTSKGIPPFLPIGLALIVGFVISLLCSALDFYKGLNRLAKCLKISYKYGDNSLFMHFLNAKNVEIVYVRDIENNLTYHGKIEFYSDIDGIKELVLMNVIVYAYDTSKEAYSVDKVYLSKPSTGLIIEVPYFSNEINDGSNAKQTNGISSTSGRADEGEHKAAIINIDEPDTKAT